MREFNSQLEPSYLGATRSGFLDEYFAVAQATLLVVWQTVALSVEFSAQSVGAHTSLQESAAFRRIEGAAPIEGRRLTGNSLVIAHVSNWGTFYERRGSRRDRQHYYRTAGDCEATTDEHYEAESKSE